MLGEALALSCALSWSCALVLFKRSESVPPEAMNLFKNVVASLLLLATLPFEGGIDWDRSAEDWWRLVLSGVLGIAIGDMLVFVALKRLGAGLLAVVECGYAPCVVLLSVLLLEESLTPSFLVGGGLVVAGLLIATRAGGGTGAGALATTLSPSKSGVWIAILALVLMAFGIVYAKPAFEGGGLIEVTLIRLLAGVAGQLLWTLPRPQGRRCLWVFRPSAVWRTLLPATVLGAYVSMILWIGGTKYTDASIAAVLNQTSVVFTLGLAWCYLGEKPGSRRLFGGGLALMGAVVVLIGSA